MADVIFCVQNEYSENARKGNAVTHLMILIVGLLLLVLLINDVLALSAELTDDVDRLRDSGDWKGILF